MKLKSYEITGYVDSSIPTTLCVNCWKNLTEEEQKPFSPICLGDEWDVAPACDRCFEKIEVNELTKKCSYCDQDFYFKNDSDFLCNSCLNEVKDMGKNLGKKLAGTNKEWIVEKVKNNHEEQVILEELVEGFLDIFTQTAQYANNTLPKLREYSGYKDSTKVGTYTDGNEDSDYNLDEIVSVFCNQIGKGCEKEIEKISKTLMKGRTSSNGKLQRI